MKSTYYALIIKTDSYAGNFEREMCAHLTGTIGDCEVGKEFINPNIQNIFEDSILQLNDEGCYRPVDLGCNVPGTDEYGVDDVAIWFNSEPTKKQKEIICERLKSFNEVASENVEVKSIHIIKIEPVTRVTSISTIIP